MDRFQFPVTLYADQNLTIPIFSGKANLPQPATTGLNGETMKNPFNRNEPIAIIYTEFDREENRRAFAAQLHEQNRPFPQTMYWKLDSEDLSVADANPVIEVAIPSLSGAAIDESVDERFLLVTVELT